MLIMHHSPKEGSDWPSLQKDTLTPSIDIPADSRPPIPVILGHLS